MALRHQDALRVAQNTVQPQTALTVGAGLHEILGRRFDSAQVEQAHRQRLLVLDLFFNGQALFVGETRLFHIALHGVDIAQAEQTDRDMDALAARAVYRQALLVKLLRPGVFALRPQQVAQIVQRGGHAGNILDGPTYCEALLVVEAGILEIALHPGDDSGPIQDMGTRSGRGLPFRTRQNGPEIVPAFAEV